jgi:WD40 repeat protein
LADGRRIGITGRRSLFQQPIDWIFGYDAFISYAWSDAQRYAEALCRELTEEHGLVCFLDATGFDVGQDLGEATRAALRLSTALILVGTEGASRSDYVLKEVRAFAELGRDIIPIDVGGSLSSAPRDHHVRAYLPEDPLYIREEVARLAFGPSESVATLILRKYGHRRQQEKRIRVFAIAAIVFAVLFVLAAVLGLLADSARKRAESESRRSRAGELSAYSREVRHRFPQRSVLLAVEAVRATRDAGEPVVLSADQAVRDSLLEIGGVGLSGHAASVDFVRFGPRAGQVISGGADGEIKTWNLATDPSTGRTLARMPAGLSAMQVSQDRHWLAAGGQDGRLILRCLTTDGLAGPPIELRGHGKRVECLTFSSDNRWLVSAGFDATARRWDLNAADIGASSVVFVGHRLTIAGTAISPDGHWLVTGGFDEPVRVWDLEGLESNGPVALLKDHHGAVRALTFSPSGDLLATGDARGAVRVYRFPGPTSPVETFTDRAKFIRAIAFCDGGSRLIAASADGVASVWSLDPKSKVPAVELRGHLEDITTFSLSPDGRRVATGSLDRTVRLWDLQVANPSGTSIVLRGHEEAVNAVAFDPCGRWLVSAGFDRTLRAWDLPRREEIVAATPLREHRGDVLGVARSHDGRWLASAGIDNQVMLWDLDVSPFPSRVPFEGPGSYVRCVAFSDDGRWLAAGGHGRITGKNSVRLRSIDTWADRTPQSRFLPNSREVRFLTFSPDGHWLVIGGDDRRLLRWGVTARDDGQIATPLQGHEGIVSAVAMAPAGDLLASGDDEGHIRLWQLSRPDPSADSRELASGSATITALAFAPDGRWLAAADRAGYAWLWRFEHDLPASGAIPLRGHTEGKLIGALAFSPDGRFVITGCDDRAARVWELWSWPPTMKATFAGHDGEVRALAVTADGRTLATFALDKTVRLWDLLASEAGGRERILARDAVDAIVCPLTDGHRLVTASADGTLWLRELDLEALLRRAGPAVGRDLSPSERRQYFPGQPVRPTFRVPAPGMANPPRSGASVTRLSGSL